MTAKKQTAPKKKAKKKASKKKSLASGQRRRGTVVSETTLLTEKEERFCYEWIAEPNQTKAALRAGYSPRRARQTGAEIMARPQVQAFIKQLQAEQRQRMKGIVERVQAERAAIAFFDPIDLFDADGNMKRLEDMPPEARRCIAGIEVSEIWEGSGEDRRQIGYLKKIKLADKSASLTALERMLGLYKDEGGNLGDAILTIRKILNEIDGNSTGPTGLPAPGSAAGSGSDQGGSGGAEGRGAIEGEVERPPVEAQ